MTHEAPGKPLPDLTTSEVHAIKPRHLEATARIIGKGALQGIVLDATPSNAIFHPRQGITIIDYSKGVSSAQQEYTEFPEGIGGNIVTPGDTADYRAAWSRVFDDGLSVLHQTFGTEPDVISPTLVSYQRYLGS